MLVSAAQLAIVMPRAHAAGRLAAWLAPLNAEMAAHAIDRDHRIEMFLATIAEETGELQVQSENLNYSGARLYELFGGLFASRATADALAARGPEAIANVIYADANRAPGYRLGNTQPGDGWKFRGRGPMQLTGRGNYERFFRAVGMPADTDPDYLLTPEGGCRSAAHFWQANGCNEIADGGDFRALTRRVNGGEFNMPTRLYYYGLAQRAMSGDAPAAGTVIAPTPPLPPVPPPPSAPQPRVLVAGCTGPDVLALQKALNATGAAVAETGAFDAATGEAVLAFQRRSGLVADGIVGPRTRAALAAAATARAPERPTPAPPTSGLPPVPGFWEQLGALIRRIF